MSEQQQKTVKPAKLASARRKKVVEGQPAEEGMQSLSQVMGRVHVTYGAYENDFDLAGKTLAYVREHLSHVWNIPPDALAVVNSEAVAQEMEKTVVLQNQNLCEFVMDSGDKGASPYQ